MVHTALQAEQFLLEMMKLPRAPVLLTCLSFKLTFPKRIAYQKDAARVLEAACDDVKMSAKLRTLLGMVLQLGNQLNGASGQKVKGFTLDSLLKLSHTKAFKSNTTVRVYVQRTADRKISRRAMTC